MATKLDRMEIYFERLYHKSFYALHVVLQGHVAKKIFIYISITRVPMA